MGDFDGGGRRWVRITAAVLAVVVVGLSTGAAGLWIGRSNATAAGASPLTAGASGGPMAPSWPATIPAPVRAVGTADAGLGWRIPNTGAAGPFSVTDQGVPFGYRQDLDGAALAAVNAVVAGKYLAATFVDPWSALGFLADPGYADRGGSPELEAFFTGPSTPEVAGAAGTPSVEPAAVTQPTGGGRVVGVQAAQVSAPAGAVPAGAVRAVVLWQSFSFQYRPDGQQGYTVRIAPVSVLLVWAAGDWKVAQVGGPPAGMDTVVLGVVPATFPVPAESWHR
jgi:hypothetical protein